MKCGEGKEVVLLTFHLVLHRRLAGPVDGKATPVLRAQELLALHSQHQCARHLLAPPVAAQERQTRDPILCRMAH
jgi:hypothetical protein